MSHLSNCPLCDHQAASRRLPEGYRYFDCLSEGCGPTEISWLALQHLEQKVPEARARIAVEVANARRRGDLVTIRRDLTPRHGMAGRDLILEERRMDCPRQAV
ncbi:hypothetical protein CF68_22515 [Cupriavidus sp. SK-4]|nr:hypothetical protein CF68_22515 [Cupriavidus sp. SK-4]